jgi:plastocyanin
MSVAIVVSGLSACSSASTKAVSGPNLASANQVVISDYRFVPRTLTVPVGTTVTWVNGDVVSHTVTRHTLADEPFDSGLLGYQGVFTHTFRTPGSYAYLCLPHASMQGTIVVQ